jgi:protein KRI1
MFDDDDDFQQGQRKDNGFKVNRGFERKFNERKKREDLEKAKSKYGKNFEQLGKGEDDSSDSSLEEDDDARLDSDEVTLKLFSTISKLRQKKPEIYEKEKKFFRPDDLGDSTNIGKRSRADQPLTYKKLVRDRALAGDLGENDSEEDDQKEAEETPFEVQQRLKAEFKSAAKGGEKKVKKTDDMDEDEEEDDNFFKVKTKTKQQIKDEEDEFKRFVENQKKRDREDAKDLQKVWGDSNNLSEEDKFLRKYLLTKGWLEKSDDDDEGDSKDNGNEFKFGYSADTKTKKSKADTSDMAEENFTHAVEPGDPYRNWKHDQQLADEEDEARSEEVDQFEEKINFRYEQPGGNRLQTYERNNTDSLRVKDTKRAEKRKEKEERKEEEKLSFRKEVEHIKQLKKDEIERKIKQLMQAGGLSKDKSEKTLAKLMNEDFDDQAFDRQMNNVFNNDYYEDEEEDEEELKKYVEEVEEDVDKMIAGDDKEQAKGDKGAKGAGDEEEDVVLKPSTNVPITMKKKINKEEAEVLKTAMNDPLWWYCDQCGRGIKALEPRFDCMECEDYTECKQCAELKQHEHQMKKFIVPEGIIYVTKRLQPTRGQSNFCLP